MFTWIPIFEELADTLLQYRGRQEELIRFIQELSNKGLTVISYEDRDADGPCPLAEIDPFTFFANFNRNTTFDNRETIVRRIKDHFGLNSELPKDWDGIPSVDSRNSWFFPFASKRAKDDISSLWALAEAAIGQQIDRIDASLFDRCLRIKQIGLPKLTMGLFWLRPRKYLSIDSRVKKYLEQKGLVFTGKDFDAYRHFVQKVRQKHGNDYAQISRQAFLEQTTLLPNNEVGKDPNKKPMPEIVGKPQNKIFYGPPGTGKTYKIRHDILPHYEDRTSSSREKYCEELVRDYSWWRVIAAVLLDLGQASVPQIVKHDLLQAKARTSQLGKPNPRVWTQLQLHTVESCPRVKYERRADPTVFDKLEQSMWRVHRDELEQSAPDAIELYDRWKNEGAEPIVERRYEFITFHQSYGYEEFVEGICPVLDEEDEGASLAYRLVPGVFRRICKRAKDDPGRRYAIFIDEINRGQIGQIFGELITLIELDKRLGAEHEIKVTLPYSKEEFGVPVNLDIFGTMNTADRSIAFIDTALRRRFSFEEIKPDAGILRKHLGQDGVVGRVNVATLLETINRRIEYLFDRDHQIGHSYFINVGSLDELKSIFLNNIIPLLQEYFYDDWSKICLVLGCPSSSREGGAVNRDHRIISVEELDEKQMADIELVGDETRARYDLSNEFCNAEGDELAEYFIGIIESSAS